MHKPSLKDPAVIFLTFFGSGLIPKIPGTIGSLAAIPLFFVHRSILFPILLILIPISSFLAHKAQQKYQTLDPSWIVIDEVLGMMTAFLFLKNCTLSLAIAVFLLFRFFDILKIWPCNYIDRKIKTGFGIMADDLVAGIYAGISALLIQNYFFS